MKKTIKYIPLTCSEDCYKQVTTGVELCKCQRISTLESTSHSIITLSKVMFVQLTATLDGESLQLLRLFLIIFIHSFTTIN